MVEFALVFALLMMMTLGLVSFARAYNVYQTMTRAAREGARMAVLPTCATCGNAFIDPASGVTQANSAIFSNYIAPALRASSLDPVKVSNYSETVTWLNPNDADQQCGAIIGFQYPYTFVIPFTKTNLTTFNLVTQVRMRREDQTVSTSGGTSTAACP